MKGGIGRMKRARGRAEKEGGDGNEGRFGRVAFYWHSFGCVTLRGAE